MEGKKIQKVYDFNQEYMLLVLEDGSALMVKTVAIMAADEVADLRIACTPVSAKQEEKKPEKVEEPAKDEKKEDKKPTKKKAITKEAIEEMTYEELTELCEENEDIDIDASAYKKKEVEELREDILSELGLGDDDPEEEQEEEEETEEDSDITWESLLKMDYDELTELCSEEKLDVEPEDYDSDEEKELRKAIARELQIEVPKKGK